MTRLFSRCAALVAVLAVCTAAVTTMVATAPPASAYANDLLRLEGHGWGHGRGLGQYGSYGYAVDEGRTYDWILDHFYGGTTAGTKPEGDITVRLTDFDTKDMLVTSGSPFEVSGTTFLAGEAALVHHTATGADVSKGPSCGGPWTKVASLGPPTPVATTTYAGDDVKLMLRACGPTGNVRSYRGTLSLVASATSTWVVNTLPMEQYLRGVVPRESPASWGDAGGGKGLEALKSQAVAARSYAWAESRSTLFKTCDTTSCQVYGGAGLNGLRIEDSRSDAAVAATAGQIRLTSAGGVARTEFSSSTGGYTAGGNFTAVPDTGDDTPNNPNHNWVSQIPTTTVEKAYPTIGTLRAVSITKRNALGVDGGRAVTVQLTGTSGSTTVTGDALRSKLGLKSDWFTPVDVALDVHRVQGDDRVATAAAVSADLFTAGAAQAAVLVSSQNYPDALVGVPLAMAKGGPILLSDAAAVPEATMAELKRATGGGPKTVYLLGGTVALSDGVKVQLEGAGFQVVRYGGATRYATAVQVAEALGNPTTILESTGTNFPDALAAGAAAGKAKGAVLLTAGSTQAAETAAYLQGKTGLVRYAVGAEAAAADPSAKPLKGADRYDTATKVANQFFPGPVVAGLASGTTFADALGGGLHAAMKGGPLLLSAATTLPITTKQYLQGNSDVTLRDLYVYGGQAAVSDAVITDLKKR
jgi:SpoIID/LytB domain protein